ncbi:mycofactocin biosynthesis glycosyltransferase MftF [Nocardioides panacihumi]|uniref:Mycofactocin biosynthesis glycosyltransferase MftF n=1 Tax=Nocardioides panacihumi TaxID=400774 RepID=A0ABN2RKU1_9ACTN
MTLPTGFAVRIRGDVRRLEGSRVLVGGSPLRAVRLSAVATDLLDGDDLVVRDSSSATLARRLLDGNLADPVPGPTLVPDALTVVIPVRDRAEQLDRCLAALTGLVCIVVDDASVDPSAVREVTERHGARLVVLATNVGPAGARNAGLRHVTTPHVAFVDSDVTVSPGTLLALGHHFADPQVALIGPLVRGRSRSGRPRWFERYDVAASSLALGRRSCSVRPGAAVGWLPSACLVGRVEALGNGFAAEMQVGEDVDLVWRLVEAGHVVRYDPGQVAHHDVRTTVRGWLGRKVVYGSGGADLGRRHGDAVAPAILSPAMGLAAAAVLLRGRWSLPIAGVAAFLGARSVRAALPPVRGRAAVASRLSITGLGWAVRQESALLLRHWWPMTALLCMVSRQARRALATAVVVDAAVALTVERPRVGPLTGWVGRRLDDLAYGTGLWLGAIRARDARCLAIRVTK